LTADDEAVVGVETRASEAPEETGVDTVAGILLRAEAGFFDDDCGADTAVDETGVEGAADVGVSLIALPPVE
jgi:hypothetical protein